MSDSSLFAGEAGGTENSNETKSEPEIDLTSKKMQEEHLGDIYSLDVVHKEAPESNQLNIIEFAMSHPKIAVGTLLGGALIFRLFIAPLLNPLIFLTLAGGVYYMWMYNNSAPQKKD